MTTKEFVDRLSSGGRWGLAKGVLHEILGEAFDLIDDVVQKEGSLHVGTRYFKLVTRKPRDAKNPRSGEVIQVPERKFVVYKKRVPA